MPTRREAASRQDPGYNYTALIESGKTDKTTVVTYTVKFYYTPQFAKVTDDIPLTVAGIVADTNQAYINSEIPIRVRAHCIEEADIGEIVRSTRTSMALVILQNNSTYNKSIL